MRGKKGLLEDIGTFIIVVILLVIIGFIIAWIVTSIADDKEKESKVYQMLLESSYTTRVLLDYEIEPGYKVYDLVLDTTESGKYDEFEQQMGKIVDGIYGNQEKWIFRIGTKEMLHNTNSQPFAVRAYWPGVFIPNPSGGSIEVLFKKIEPSDELFEENGQDILRIKRDDWT